MYQLLLPTSFQSSQPPSSQQPASQQPTLTLNFTLNSHTQPRATHDIAESTYKTFNQPTRQKSDRIQGFQHTYKGYNLPTRLSTNYKTKIRPPTRLSTNLLDRNPTAYKTFFKLLDFLQTTRLSSNYLTFSKLLGFLHTVRLSSNY